MTTSTHDHTGFAGTRQAISFIMDSVLAEVTDDDKMEPQFMSLTNTEFFKRVLATKPPFNPGVEGPSQVKYSVRGCSIYYEFQERRL